MSEVVKKIYVGLDISKDTIDVYILPCKEHFKIDNKASGFKKLIKKLSAQVESIVLESSSKYGRDVMKALQKAGYSPAMINPRWVKHFSRSTGELAKNDKIDAQICALYAERLKPEPTTPAEESREELLELEHLRRNFIRTVAGLKARLHVTPKSLQPFIRRTIRSIEKEIDKLTTEINELVAENKQWGEHLELWKEVQGVGEKVALSLLANLPELGRVSNKAIAALAGLAPYDCESGKYKGARRIAGGRSAVRESLRMGMLTAVRFEPKIREFYQRLLKKGKKKSVALTACARKLLVILNARTRDAIAAKQALLMES